MKNAITLMMLLASSAASAAELEPLSPVKRVLAALFCPDKPADAGRPLDAGHFVSDFDRQYGGVKSQDAGASLYAVDRELESGQCAGAGCNAADARAFQQKRGGIAWNLTGNAPLRIAPHASVVRYQMGMPLSPTAMPVGNQPGQVGVGFGLGFDSAWRISPAVSAYASAGVTQFDQRKGYEGLMGLSTQLSQNRLFVEARWLEMVQSSSAVLESNYGFSNVRVGISRRFNGL